LLLLHGYRHHPSHVHENGGGRIAIRLATVDADCNYLDGSKNYRLHLPPNIPVMTFWSIIPYDTQTRSVLQTDRRDTTLTSETGSVKANPDGSIDIYFGPHTLPGKEQLDPDSAGQGMVHYPSPL
jgi:hypothetical protein